MRLFIMETYKMNPKLIFPMAEPNYGFGRDLWKTFLNILKFLSQNGEK